MVLVSVKSIRGKRDYMEDRYTYLEKNGITIAMVCDGHGGYQVAAETVRDLPNLLIKNMANAKGTNVHYAKLIRETIIKWGSEVKNYKSGSTLTGILVKDDIVYIFNLGDSRTCLSLVPSAFIYMLKATFDNTGDHTGKVMIDYTQTQFFCTPDHDSDAHVEKDRVKNAGGRITEKRLNGILSVTRALGDTDVGPGISHVPEIFWTRKTSVAGPIVMYSDGIYELQRYKKHLNFDNDNLYYIAANNSADALVDYAYQNGSEDNLTAMVVRI